MFGAFPFGAPYFGQTLSLPTETPLGPPEIDLDGGVAERAIDLDGGVAHSSIDLSGGSSHRVITLAGGSRE